jgi:hypothetical protein
MASGIRSSLRRQHNRLQAFTSSIDADADPYWDKVVALLHMDGTAGTAGLTDATGKVWSAAGQLQLSAAQSKFGGTSALFDGSGDYASTPHDSSLALAHVDFTLEAWVYNTATTAGNQVILNKDGVFGSSYPSWFLAINSARKLIAVVGNGNGVSYSQSMASTGTVTINTWVHVAVARSGNTVRLFLDGVLDSTHTITGTPVDGGKALYIGNYSGNSNAADMFNGWIDEVRVTRGVARYTAAFTPRQAPFPAVGTTLSGDEVIDPHYGNVTCLLPFDGYGGSTIFTDATGKTWTANGNAQLDATQSKFGGSSAMFDGTGDYLSAADAADFEVGADAFTLEFWLRRTAVSGSSNVCCLFSKGRQNTAGYASYGLFINTNNLYLVASSTGTSYAITATGSGSILNDTWYHVALVRDSASWRVYLNGVLDISSATSVTPLDTAYGPFIAGEPISAGVARDFNGRLDNLRLTKGVARYTSGFVPPTRAFPNRGVGERGPELLENGGFDDTSEWTTPAGSSISGGQLHSTDATNKTVYQAETLEANTTYEVTFTVTAYGGTGYVAPRFNVSPYDGTNLISGTTRTATGTYTERMTTPAAGTDRFELRFNNPNGISVDNVSCKKVL